VPLCNVNVRFSC